MFMTMEQLYFEGYLLYFFLCSYFLHTFADYTPANPSLLVYVFDCSAVMQSRGGTTMTSLPDDFIQYDHFI